MVMTMCLQGSLTSGLQKTVDIHPPKTGISVHFSDSFTSLEKKMAKLAENVHFV
jgi:hypothetical protein